MTNEETKTIKTGFSITCKDFDNIRFDADNPDGEVQKIARERGLPDLEDKYDITKRGEIICKDTPDNRKILANILKGYRTARLNEKGTNRNDFRFVLEGWLKGDVVLNRHPGCNVWWDSGNPAVINIHRGREYTLISEIKPFLKGRPWGCKGRPLEYNVIF